MFQIEATEDFQNGHISGVYKAGTLGGYVESVDNLSDTSWVQIGSVVYGDSVVKDDSLIHDSVIKDSTIEEGSLISEEVAIEGSTITSGRISHGSKINNSTVEHSTMQGDTIRDSHVIYGDTHLSNVQNSTLHGPVGTGQVKDSHLQVDGPFDLNGENFDGVDIRTDEDLVNYLQDELEVELTADDLEDLNNLEDTQGLNR